MKGFVSCFLLALFSAFEIGCHWSNLESTRFSRMVKNSRRYFLKTDHVKSNFKAASIFLWAESVFPIGGTRKRTMEEVRI